MTMAMLMAADGVTINGPLVVASFDLFGITFNLTESIIVQWLVMLILLAVILVLTHNLKVIPTTRRQALAELLVTTAQNLVKDGMGEKYRAYIPYIGSLFAFSIISSLMGLLGLRTPTADISVTGTWAVITFVLVQYNRAKTGKFKGYMKAFVQPMAFMLPFNIIGEFANPLSLALRHFGNLIAGMVISALIYFALGNFAILVPAVASLYFDIFSAFMQAYIFVMLTMSYISGAEVED